MHSYANILNPITFVGADQYRVVTVYTDYTEVEVGSEFTEEVVESTEEVHVQAELCEAQMEAAEDDGDAGEEMEALGSHVAEPGENVDVAKALETLTKTFTLKKEAMDLDASAEKVDDSNEAESEEFAAIEGTAHEVSVQLDNDIDDVPQPGQTVEGATESKDFGDEEESVSVSQGPTGSSSEPPVTETQQSAPDPETQNSPTNPETQHPAPGPETQPSPSSEDVRRSTRLESKKSTRMHTLKAKTSSKENIGKHKKYSILFAYLLCSKI